MFNINSKINFVLSIAFLVATANSFAQNNSSVPDKPRKGDPVAGKEKSLLCQGCHGENGNSLSTLVPKLAGQDGGYISKQVHNFQTGARTHRIMDDLASTVNDDDIIDISAYFASQNKMKGDKPVVNRIGKSLFLTGDNSRSIPACIDCHGADGKGKEPNPSMIPMIGGQHKDYLVKQLNNFRAGSRTNSANNVMNKVTNALTDNEVESLAEYISGL